MVIKVPVYLQLDEHFHPDEVVELTDAARIGLSKDLMSKFKFFHLEYLGRDIKLRIISTKELKLLMTGVQLGNVKANSIQKLKKLKTKL